MLRSSIRNFVSVVLRARAAHVLVAPHLKFRLIKFDAAVRQQLIDSGLAGDAVDKLLRWQSKVVLQQDAVMRQEVQQQQQQEEEERSPS